MTEYTFRQERPHCQLICLGIWLRCKAKDWNIMQKQIDVFFFSNKWPIVEVRNYSPEGSVIQERGTDGQKIPRCHNRFMMPTQICLLSWRAETQAQLCVFMDVNLRCHYVLDENKVTFVLSYYVIQTLYDYSLHAFVFFNCFLHFSHSWSHATNTEINRRPKPCSNGARTVSLLPKPLLFSCKKHMKTGCVICGFVT